MDFFYGKGLATYFVWEREEQHESRVATAL